MRTWKDGRPSLLPLQTQTQHGIRGRLPQAIRILAMNLQGDDSDEQFSIPQLNWSLAAGLRAAHALYRALW